MKTVMLNRSTSLALVKTAYVNEAGSHMHGFYSDLLWDCDRINKMQVGDVCTFSIRYSGTGIVQDTEEDRAEVMKAAKSVGLRIIVFYRIKMSEKDGTYSLEAIYPDID